MSIVRMGNKAAIDTVTGRVLDSPQVTTFVVNDDDTFAHKMRDITHETGIWPRVSAAPAAWVESNDKELETALAEHFDCPVGQPE